MAGLRAMLIAHIPRLGDWPREHQQPDTVTAMDLVVFGWHHAQQPIVEDHHSFFRHDHYKFDQEVGRERWRTEINRILERNGVALRQEPDGRVVRVGTVAVGVITRSPIPSIGDDQLDEKLTTALRKYENPDVAVRKEALEALWDAFERVKSVIDPSDKKRSAATLIEMIVPDRASRDALAQEFEVLTRLGNEFQIRHHEVARHPVSAAMIDLLFAAWTCSGADRSPSACRQRSDVGDGIDVHRTRVPSDELIAGVARTGRHLRGAVFIEWPQHVVDGVELNDDLLADSTSGNPRCPKATAIVITDLTRRDLIDLFNSYDPEPVVSMLAEMGAGTPRQRGIYWCGRLDESEFLGRLYDLEALPSQTRGSRPPDTTSGSTARTTSTGTTTGSSTTTASSSPPPTTSCSASSPRPSIRPFDPTGTKSSGSARSTTASFARTASRSARCRRSRVAQCSPAGRPRRATFSRTRSARRSGKRSATSSRRTTSRRTATRSACRQLPPNSYARPEIEQGRLRRRTPRRMHPPGTDPVRSNGAGPLRRPGP